MLKVRLSTLKVRLFYLHLVTIFRLNLKNLDKIVLVSLFSFSIALFKNWDEVGCYFAIILPAELKTTSTSSAAQQTVYASPEIPLWASSSLSAWRTTVPVALLTSSYAAVAYEGPWEAFNFPEVQSRRRPAVLLCKGPPSDSLVHIQRGACWHV